MKKILLFSLIIASAIVFSAESQTSNEWHMATREWVSNYVAMVLTNTTPIVTVDGAILTDPSGDTLTTEAGEILQFD